MEQVEDSGGGEVVQVIMQDDGQIVMPEGQFIQLDTEHTQMQYIQVTGENGEEQLIQLTPEIQAQLFQVQQEEESQVIEEGEAETMIQSMVVEEDTQPENQDGQEQMHVVISSPGEASSSEITSHSTLNYQEAVTSGEPMAMTVETRTTITSPTGGSTSVVLVQPPGTLPVANVNNASPTKVSAGDSNQIQDEGIAETSITSQEQNENNESAVEDVTPVKSESEKKVVDDKNPIELTSETVVVVNGKKCVLRVDPESNHLVAYPVKQEGKRGRGRPRKGEQSQTSTPKKGQSLSPGSSSDTPRLALTEQENSAAEGLLGLSDCDGVRRSTRKRRKNKVLSEYETGAIEGVEDADQADDGATDPEAHPDAGGGGEGGIKKGLKGRPAKSSPTTPAATPPSVAANLSAPMQQMLMKMGLLPMKRGRGRPRRSPLPGTTSGGPVPAFIIPSPGGSGVMMAPIQNLSQLEALKKAPGLTVMKSPEDDEGQSFTKDPKAIIIKNQDGTETIIVESKVEKSDPTKEADEGEEQDMAEEEGDKSVEKSVDGEAEGKEEEADEEATENKKDLVPGPPAAIVQLPQDLVQLLLPQKPPVKIGLKATESELEKLKCPKCDFQAYFQQQFQEHIGTHPEVVEKCKCCNHLCFTEEELLDHFREAHPRCICPECNFTAEHAYVIKRHRIRHNNQGCECEICGKKYKDPYILKMHIKMVHMPAEVLYCCDICKKKFTRKAHLKRHLRIHEPEKPFKCPHCDYRGCERSDITKHVLIHEEPKHSCDVCGKTFRHMKNKDLHVKRHKGQRDYKCGVCDFYGYTFTDIRKHIERKHADAKTIACDKCGSTFRNELQLRDHQRRQCEVLMLEQTVSVAGPDGQTIQIPASQLTSDGHIMVDGNKVKFTVEPLTLGDDAISMTLQDGQLISTDGQVIDTSQVEMTEISIGEQQHAMDVEQVELATAELVASSTEQEMVQEMVQEGELIQDGTGLVHGTQIISEDGILTIAQ